MVDFPIQRGQFFSEADKALAYVQALYDESCTRIRCAFDVFLKHGTPPTDLDQATYPFVGFKIDSEHLFSDASFSYGVIQETGLYGTTVTCPDLFREYLHEQISLIIERHQVEVCVGLSCSPIPFSFVVDHAPMQLEEAQLRMLQTLFVQPSLSRIDDVTPNGETDSSDTFLKPLALFSGERVDYSLHRLHHYTGTSPEHFQSFILLTNYQRYIDPFIQYGIEQLQNDSGFEEFIGPGDVLLADKNGRTTESVFGHLPQMPAYHLKHKTGKGITFINIGVGPSNAKTITDHLAVLRPDCWLMLGHCAGLRSSQLLGDYVLAHAYVRDDHVLDQDLPHWIPLPALAEVQVALQQAVKNITDEKDEMLKSRLRTGTLLTTDNRNWELRSKELYQKFKQTRAIAIDMESATVAANGFRFRVPYGTLLCVSDKPIHGEIKLQGMANTFYRKRVHQHLQVGLEAVRIMREQGAFELHSRKLRGFDEPAFR